MNKNDVYNAARLMMSSGSAEPAITMANPRENGIVKAYTDQGYYYTYYGVIPSGAPQSIITHDLYTVLMVPDDQNEFVETLVTFDLGTDHYVIVKTSKGWFDERKNLITNIYSNASDSNVSANASLSYPNATLGYLNVRRPTYFMIMRKSDDLPILITVNLDVSYCYHYIEELGKDTFVENRFLSGFKRSENDSLITGVDLLSLTESAFGVTFRIRLTYTYKNINYNYPDKDFEHDTTSVNQYSGYFTVVDFANPWTYRIIYERPGAISYDYIREIIEDLYTTHEDDKYYVKFSGISCGGSASYSTYTDPNYVYGVYDSNGNLIFCSHYYDGNNQLRVNTNDLGMTIFKEDYVPTDIPTDIDGHLLFARDEVLTVKVLYVFGSYNTVKVQNEYELRLEDYWPSSFEVSSSTTPVAPYLSIPVTWITQDYITVNIIVDHDEVDGTMNTMTYTYNDPYRLTADISDCGGTRPGNLTYTSIRPYTKWEYRGHGLTTGAASGSTDDDILIGKIEFGRSEPDYYETVVYESSDANGNYVGTLFYSDPIYRGQYPGNMGSSFGTFYITKPYTTWVNPATPLGPNGEYRTYAAQYYTAPSSSPPPIVSGYRALRVARGYTWNYTNIEFALDQYSNLFYRNSGYIYPSANATSTTSYADAVQSGTNYVNRINSSLAVLGDSVPSYFPSSDRTSWYGTRQTSVSGSDINFISRSAGNYVYGSGSSYYTEGLYLTVNIDQIRDISHVTDNVYYDDVWGPVIRYDGGRPYIENEVIGSAKMQVAEAVIPISWGLYSQIHLNHGNWSNADLYKNWEIDYHGGDIPHNP